MLKQNTPLWKIIAIILLIIAILATNYWFMTHSRAEECWILCQPDSYVNARMNPQKKSMEIGRFECGDKAYTDGKVKNGYLHLIDLNFEMCEGWIAKGYVVYSEPVVPAFINTRINSKGRVVARRTINGKRRCWLKDGQSIKVYMISEEWSVTNKGFVKSKYIDIGQ